MKHWIITFSGLAGLLAVMGVPAKAAIETTVSANHTVYFAGHTLGELRTLAVGAGYHYGETGFTDDDDYWDDLDDGTGSLPGVYVDLAGLGDLVSISAAGLWGKHGDVSYHTGPEGVGPSDANISQAQYGVFGISLLDAPKQLLVGVFLSDAKPDPLSTPPEAPVIRDTGDLITTPALNQAFGIGANLQGIQVPDGATRLYFGMHNGHQWSNNSGSVEVTVAPIPEPTSLIVWFLLGPLCQHRRDTCLLVY